MTFGWFAGSRKEFPALADEFRRSEFIFAFYAGYANFPSHFFEPDPAENEVRVPE
jgi:hypothetical protein